MNKLFKRVAAATAVALTVPAFAAIDITAAQTGIADAQVAVLAVLGTMIVMAAAVYGVKKVLSLIGR
jgi:uncharacterized PurR-regulated membrane protein YhhQ (DUF165 family)